MYAVEHYSHTHTIPSSFLSGLAAGMRHPARMRLPLSSVSQAQDLAEGGCESHIHHSHRSLARLLALSSRRSHLSPGVLACEEIVLRPLAAVVTQTEPVPLHMYTRTHTHTHTHIHVLMHHDGGP